MSRTPSSIDSRLKEAAEQCRKALTDAPFTEVVARLGRHGQPPAAFELLSELTADVATGQALRQLCASSIGDSELNLVERAVLLLASQHAATAVPQLPVSQQVKELFADEFEFFANPSPAWIPQFRHDNVRFREMARIATLRRFPAGQFHWEISGFPRSWAAKTRQPWRILAEIVRMGGFSPLFELHLNSRRKNRLILLETEANLSYYRAALSVKLQPNVKGLILTSWLFCETTARVTPHLAWLRAVPQSGGALIVDIGPAPPNSGFMTGSEERRRLYENGEYQPRLTCVLWLRTSLLQWARERHEFLD
jgi:hypothetical protein